MTWGEILERMRHRAAENRDERYGQALFNELYEIEPDVANLVRGTEADPFFAEKMDDSRIRKFFDTIYPYFV